ncbi:unnamed protein product [Parascedosporium putredinis]|uniref:FAD-binding PCMH-type domain-containing protein n=1 Tax=Parascedosporium putredinis TaxID=1442378 RepID=A0A9P1M6R1_9PEZI|nr:unnamed protein product [Parascedosporium putredinis]CAI7990184.1 unnamed protein product [Parascedosporium putredinis]
MAFRHILSNLLILLAGAPRLIAQSDSVELTSCCQALADTFPDEISTSTLRSSVYEKSNTRVWSASTILSPACVFQPTTVKNLAAAVAQLANDSCEFAIKSGGYNPIAGAANIDAGVAIDLNLLNQVELRTDGGGVISLGAGALWRDVYDKFENEGIGFAGSQVGFIGVSGLVLGGGYSYFQASAGWAADTVVNFEVVLASGEIVNANQAANSDLFKALKGGGGNFGIVTKVFLQTWEQGTLWAGIKWLSIQPEDAGPLLLGRLRNFTVQNNDNTRVTASVEINLSSGAPPTARIDFVNIDGVEDAIQLESFANLEHYDDAVWDIVEEWTTEVSKATDELGMADPFVHLNFAGRFQKPFCGYGADNLEFLREVAGKYDPDQVFQELVPGGFKLNVEC